MSAITTHVLDTVLGRPAAGVRITLEKRAGEVWTRVSASLTDGDGRCHDLTAEASAGVYRLTFATGKYFADQGRSTIYPEVTITFACGSDSHYHLPLLLTENSYTTYRGS
jgi:5-hydroxyisourate hydrolase